MKIRVNKHKLNIHYRGSPWGSWPQQHAHCLRYAHSHPTESHLGKKQPQAKIAIAFPFDQPHFSNVTSHALFYGGHRVMRSKRCAVQKPGNHLKGLFAWTWLTELARFPRCRLTSKSFVKFSMCSYERAGWLGSRDVGYLQLGSR